MIIATLAAALASPATSAQYFAVTPSGATEVLFAQAPSEVGGKLSSRCIDLGWTVITSAGTEVICEAPMNFGQSLVGTLLMGNSYSTPPRRFFKYTISNQSGISRVQASGWMELQMAFGQVRRTDFSGPEFHNGAMNFMVSAGGKLPTGTRFPNHTYLGIMLAPSQNGNVSGMRVTTVQPDSPAAQAGLQAGDLVTSVAQKRLKGEEDYLEASARAAKVPSYQVEIVRDGKPLKLSVNRAFRPTYSETLTAQVAQPVEVSVVADQTVSVADELAKLAKLKADGLLTQAEFDQQKAKLLSR